MINSQIGVLSSRKKLKNEIVSSTFNFSQTGKPGSSSGGSFDPYCCDFDLPKSDLFGYDIAYAIGASYNTGFAQVITPNKNCYLTDITYNLNAVGTPTGPIYVRLFEITGTSGVDAIPYNNAKLSDYSNELFGITADTIPTSPYPSPVNFANPTWPVPLEVGKYYMITFEYYGGDANNYINIYTYNNLNYNLNSAIGTVAVSMTALTNELLCYRTCGYTDSFTTIKYDFSNGVGYVNLGISGKKKYGVVVTGNGGIIKSFDILIYVAEGAAANTANLQCEVFLLSGGFPTGSSLMTFNLVYILSIYSSGNNYIRFTPTTTGITLTSGTNYGFVISTDAANPATDVALNIQANTTSSTYTNNTFYQNHGSSTWVNEVSTTDLVFMVETNFPLVESAFAVNDVAANGDQYNYIAGTGENTRIAQSFTGVAGLFSKVTVSLRKTGSPTGNITAVIYAHTAGGFGTTGTPTGSALATSDVLSAASVSTTETPYTLTFSGANQFSMIDGTNYWISLEFSGGNTSNKIGVVMDISSPTAPGRAAYYNGTTWSFTTGGTGTSGASDDMCYILYGLF